MSELEIEMRNGTVGELPQCHTCLSANRKLFPISGHASVFRRLVPPSLFSVKAIKELQLCWECSSLLRRVTRFRIQVQKANELFRNGQSYIYGTLSSLATVVQNDTYPNIIYVTETNINADATDCKDWHDIVNKEHNDVDFDDDREDAAEPTEEGDIDKELIDENVTTITKDEKKVKVNKWVMKRAMQNKKPKFKMLTGKDLKLESVFRRIPADLNSECDGCENLVKEELGDKTDSENSEKEAKYECTLCSYHSDSKKLAEKHTFTHDKVLQCIKCGLMFAERREFFKHFKEWHEKFTCDHCGISFKMRYCIKNHIRKQHSPFECKPCNKRFARYNGLWVHNKVRHGAPAPAAYCVECDRRYPDQRRYRWHLASSARHTPREKRRIPCPECEKVFSKNIYMKDHYNLVHLKQYKYRCEDCNKNFIRNADLVKHKRRIHEGILPPKNKICYMCGRGFTTNKILTNHLRTHTGERPFACDHCPARFAQKTALAGHVRALHQNTGRNPDT